ncbi:MAG: family 1 glycosylhydrolase [Chloroflexi bacterium]|nr:family 1 glycosylhydrolase [Chloroflexota bacterium]
MAEMRAVIADAYLERLRGDDFVGVQNYARMLISVEGIIHPGSDVEVNQMGEEIYPEALGGAVRYAAEVSGGPVYVTENGLATTDDAQRVAYFQRALASLADRMRDGVDVRGYVCWSALDNFEWVGGFRPKFGIIDVDRATQARTPRPSAHWLGAVARTGQL